MSGGPSWDGPTAIDEDVDAARVLLGPEETVAVSRKKLLLRLLAREAAARRGLSPSTLDLAASEAVMRVGYGLTADVELGAWLERAGIWREAFDAFVRDAALIGHLGALLSREIDAELTEHRAVVTRSPWQDTPRWLQFDLALPDGPQGRAASAATVFERLRPLVEPGKRERSLSGFFMTRKPPGLRLRLSGEDPDSLAAQWREPLDELAAKGALCRWSRVPYEPEMFRFGGPEGCALAHRWFEADTLGWMRLEPVALRGGLKPSRELISLALLNDLFFAALEDAAEVWDVWCRLARMHGLPLDAAAPRAPVVRIDTVLGKAGAPERDILTEYEGANQRLALELRGLRGRGELRVGPRALLATLALFHWNRFGLAPAARARLVFVMLRALDPNPPGAAGGE